MNTMRTRFEEVSRICNNVLRLFTSRSRTLRHYQNFNELKIWLEKAGFLRHTRRRRGGRVAEGAPLLRWLIPLASANFSFKINVPNFVGLGVPTRFRFVSMRTNCGNHLICNNRVRLIPTQKRLTFLGLFSDGFPPFLRRSQPHFSCKFDQLLLPASRRTTAVTGTDQILKAIGSSLAERSAWEDQGAVTYYKPATSSLPTPTGVCGVQGHSQPCFEVLP